MMSPVLDLRQRAETDFWFFCKEIMGFKDLYEPLHKPVCEFLQKSAEAPEKYTCLLIPRGHFKTSLASVSYSIWRLLRDPDMSILIVHGKLDSSIAMLREIKIAFTHNDVLRELWSDIIWDNPKADADLWHQDQIQVKRERADKQPSVFAASVDATVVGKHFDLIVHDDIVTDKTVTTEMQREVTKRYRRESEALQRTDDCKVINIGTRWHEDDAHAELLDPTGPYAPVNGKPQVRSLVLSAVADEAIAKWIGCEEGDPIFPTRYTHDRLERLRVSMTEYPFSCQFLNNPRPDLFRAFTRNDLRWFTPLKDGSPPTKGQYRVFSAIDPNRSEKQSADFCVLITAAVDEDGHIWVVDMRRGHPSGPQIVDWVRECVERWAPEFVCVETQNFQLQLCKWLKEDQLKSGVHYKILEVIRSRANKKYERIMAMQPLVAAGGLHIKKSAWGDDLAIELDRYGPRAKHDDILDALADIYANGVKARPEKHEKKVAKDPFVMESLLEQVGVFSRPHVVTNGPRRVHSVG